MKTYKRNSREGVKMQHPDYPYHYTALEFTVMDDKDDIKPVVWRREGGDE